MLFQTAHYPVLSVPGPPLGPTLTVRLTALDWHLFSFAFWSDSFCPGIGQPAGQLRCSRGGLFPRAACHYTGQRFRAQGWWRVCPCALSVTLQSRAQIRVHGSSLKCLCIFYVYFYPLDVTPQRCTVAPAHPMEGGRGVTLGVHLVQSFLRPQEFWVAD
jgi:hypothetical protein